MSGHSMYCNTENNKRCDCYLSRRQPVARTWFETGKAHYEAGLPCDERYPLEYVKGYADAASIVGITCYKRHYDIATGNQWQADCGNDHAHGSTQAQAGARLIRWILGKRDQAAFERRMMATEQEAAQL